MSSSSQGAFQEQGVFIADGRGNITGGVDDFVQSAGLTTGQISGMYSIAPDGTGTIQLKVPRGTIELAVTLTSSSSLYLIQYDSFANAAGVALQANTTAYSTTPQGTFVLHFHSHTTTGQAPTASVGALTLQQNSIQGSEDRLQVGDSLRQVNLSGTIQAPDSNGRGMAIITDDLGSTANYLYYVIDSSTLNFLEVDPGTLAGGRLEAQSGGPFSLSNLKGALAFSSSGDTASQELGVNSAGAFVSDGQGNISSGSYDSARATGLLANLALTGNYTADSNGRCVLTLSPQGLTPISLVAWMVNSSRAFFLVDDPSKAEDGRLLQQSGSFSATSLSGSYSFYTYGSDTRTPPSVDRVGVMDFDGVSSLTFTNFFANRGGFTSQKGPVTGQYQVSPNGRVVASSVGSVDTQIIYLVSGSSGFIVLGDVGSELAGSMAQQAP